MVLTRRMALRAVSLAAIGYVVGALVGHSRRAQDKPRDNASRVEQSGPDPVDSPFPTRPEAPGADVRPDASYDTLRRAIELFRKGDMAGVDREKAALTNPVE